MHTCIIVTKKIKISAGEYSRYSGEKRRGSRVSEKSRWKGLKFSASSFKGEEGEIGEDPSKLVRDPE